jgi:hypothetical protein
MTHEKKLEEIVANCLTLVKEVNLHNMQLNKCLNEIERIKFENNMNLEQKINRVSELSNSRLRQNPENIYLETITYLSEELKLLIDNSKLELLINQTPENYLLKRFKNKGWVVVNMIIDTNDMNFIQQKNETFLEFIKRISK